MSMYTMRQLAVFITSGVLLSPQFVKAQLASSSGGGPLGDLLISIMIFINDFLIPFIIGIGFLYFVWGVFLYFIVGAADEEKRAKGRSLVVYATVGFVMIIIYWGVINMLTSSLGLEGQILENVPNISIPGF